jgi:hypothetical protein
LSKPFRKRFQVAKDAQSITDRICQKLLLEGIEPSLVQQWTMPTSRQERLMTGLLWPAPAAAL